MSAHYEVMNKAFNKFGFVFCSAEEEARYLVMQMIQEIASTIDTSEFRKYDNIGDHKGGRQWGWLHWSRAVEGAVKGHALWEHASAIMAGTYVAYEEEHLNALFTDWVRRYCWEKYAT